MKGGEIMSNVLGGGPSTRPQSYTADRIQVSLSEIKKEVQSCIISFEKVYGQGSPQVAGIEGKKQPEPDLPFVQITISLSKIIDDLKYLAGRMDSEL